MKKSLTLLVFLLLVSCTRIGPGSSLVETPNAGLSQADIVFEHFIGHQMNRITAIYYGENAEWIGSVRSGRLVDAQLTVLSQALYAYGKLDPQLDLVLREVLDDRARGIQCPLNQGALGL